MVVGMVGLIKISFNQWKSVSKKGEEGIILQFTLKDVSVLMRFIPVLAKLVSYL